MEFTRQQLIEKLEQHIDATKRHPDLPEAQLDAVILKIALDSLTAAPVAWRYRTKDKRVSSNWMLTDEERRTKESASFESEPLYVASPVHASVVPDEIEPDDDNTYDYVDGWNACRAAMLQGADGNSPVIPGDWKLVPVDPTLEMVKAGANASSTGMLIPGMYRAMLAAVPQQDEGKIKR